MPVDFGLISNGKCCTGTPERYLLPLAIRILDKVLAEYGSETVYLDKNFGRLLSFEEVGEAVHEYLEGEGLAETVAVNYIDSAASPTSMNGDRLNIRVPCLYRAWRTEGTLAHVSRAVVPPGRLLGPF